MDTTKLKVIIERKNERLEREAVDEASCIIDAIISKQSVIIRTQGEISELRAKLTTLQITQLDSEAILSVGETS